MVEDVEPAHLPGLSKKVATARSNGWTITALQSTTSGDSMFVIYAVAPSKRWQALVYGPERTKTWFKAGSAYRGHLREGRVMLEDRINSTTFWKNTTEAAQ